MKKLSIVIPVYYNQDSLLLLFKTIQEIEIKLLENKVQIELIFVDDGSGDDSLKRLLEIKKLQPSVRIIKHSRNFGSIHAIKTGLSYVNGDCFIILAADLQDPPELIVEMVEHWQEGSKYVVCTRLKRKDPFMTRVFAKIYYLLLISLVVPDYPVGGFDLALMDKIILPYILKSSKNINISLFVFSLGFKPFIIPYQRGERIHGKSRWTFKKKINYFIDSLLGFSIVPIRLISILGICISLLSFLYGFIVILQALVGGIAVHGFSALASLISFLLGLVIIMLGIIGEYLWRVFDEVNGRPEAVVEEVY